MEVPPYKLSVSSWPGRDLQSKSCPLSFRNTAGKAPLRPRSGLTGHRIPPGCPYVYLSFLEKSPTGLNCSPSSLFSFGLQTVGSLPSLLSFLVLWFLPLAMISGSWLGSAKATAVLWGFPGASALEPHAHPLPVDLLTQWHSVLIPWHGRYYPMKSVLYIFFTIGHTYTDMYIYLYNIYLS